MKLPASLSKLKSLFPVFVVGASVAITIKLLTESTPLTSEILSVQAVEDIQKTEYQDELTETVEEEDQKQEEPPAPQEPKPEESQEQSQPQEDSEKKEDEPSSEQKNEEEKNQKEKQDNQKTPKSGPRKFKSDSNNPAIGILKQLLVPSKKKG